MPTVSTFVHYNSQPVNPLHFMTKRSYITVLFTLHLQPVLGPATAASAKKHYYPADDLKQYETESSPLAGHQELFLQQQIRSNGRKVSCRCALLAALSLLLIAPAICVSTCHCLCPLLLGCMIAVLLFRPLISGVFFRQRTSS